MEKLIDPKKTALVVIDLQKWLGNQYAPYSAEQVIDHSAALAEAFRKAGAFVALVHVSSKDMKDIPQPKLDVAPPQLNLPSHWDELVSKLNDHLLKQVGSDINVCDLKSPLKD
ncbi:isochorismatase family protein [Sporolactobacillus pectinivorans]|uniref:isochorismatase family protein n=1 Tax=Sporolactobacillus pectinivorans TaxID=1591408 RepID=UPI000C26105D|nr:isochorismatase family protein [Sporolactobacillus pectinivorans]